MSAVLGSTPDAPAPRPRWRRRIIAGAVAVLLVGGLSAGALGARWYLHTGEQPAAALPKSTLAYLSVDLDPSGREKLAAHSVLDKLPVSTTEHLGSVGDFRKRIVEKIFDATDCASLDFKRDIDPWLGDRAAMAMMPVPGDGPEPVAVLQSTDNHAASAGMKTLQGCGGSGFGAWAFHGSWIVWGPSQSVVDAVQQADRSGSLADSDDFRSAIDAAGGPGLVNGYISKDAITAFLPMMGSMARMLPTGTLHQLTAAFPRIGLTVRADSGQVRLTVVSTSPQKPAVALSGDVSSDMGSLPSDSTAAAAYDFKGLADSPATDSLRRGFRLGLGQGLADAGAPAEIAQMTKHFEDVLGAPIDKVFADLMDGSIVAALGPASLDAVSQSPANLPLAVKLTPGASRDRVFGYYRRLAADQPIGEWASASPTSLVFGTSKAFRDQVLAGGGRLGESSRFRSVLDLNGHDVLGALYVDLQSGLVKDSIARGLAEQDPRWLDNVKHLEAVGLAMSQSGATSTVELRISLN